jgi:geranylgeranyl diphosphate synthase, type II
LASSLDVLMKEHAALLVRFMTFHFEAKSELTHGHDFLLQSVRYSLLQEGGKRFRPVLAMLTAEALGQRAERVLPFAAAVECVHTYSLIHDDLPAMDNDDMRRGQATNHRKFDEATAILAGDALLTEAFQIIADNYSAEPALGLRAVAETAKAAGLYGMVGGQSIDMSSKTESISNENLQAMHTLKTGALIRLSAVGSAILCGANPVQQKDLTVFAENLGLAFQIADDILDFDPSKLEPGSYPAILGIEKTRTFLNELTETCLTCLKHWPSTAEPLRQIAIYNRARLV